MEGFQHGIPGGAPPLQQTFTSQIPSLCSATEKLTIQKNSVSRQQNMGAREHQNAFDPFLSRRPRHEDLYRPHGLTIQNSQSVSRQQNMGAREHQNVFDPFLSRKPRHEDLYRPHGYQSDYSKYKLKYLQNIH